MRDFIKIQKDRIEFLDSRFYQHANGNFYPSVTTILDAYPKSAAFFEWLKRNGEDSDEIRDEAGRKGSTVHQLCEDYDNGLECSILSPVSLAAQYKQIEWAMFERYVEFRTKINAELLVNEVHYISLTHGFAGTLDRVFEIDGVITLVDIKTANALHNHYWLQMAAYKKLWDEVNPDMQIEETKILWLNAKTRTEGKGKAIQGIGWQLVGPENPLDHYWNLFQSVYMTWQEENQTLKPRNNSYQLTHSLNGKEKEFSTLSDIS